MCWGSFFKMDFRRRQFNHKSLVFRKNPRTHLEVQGQFGDEGTFQECQKSWILKIPLFGETEKRRPGVYFDAEYVSARSRHAKTAWIAIWSKIFVFGRKSSFSLSSPVDPLLSPYRTKLGSQGAKVAWLADWLVAWWHKVVRIETNHWSGCYSAKNWLYRQTKQQNHEKSICSQKLVFSLF